MVEAVATCRGLAPASGGSDWNIRGTCVVIRGMTSLSPWLKPTLLGPLLTLWTLTTIGSITVGMATLSGGRLDNWAVGMLWASFFGCTLGVLAVAVDVLLLRLKWRQLPTGGRAWFVSVLSPFAVGFVASLPFWPPPETAAGVVLFVFLSMLLATFGLRMIFGRRP